MVVFEPSLCTRPMREPRPKCSAVFGTRASSPLRSRALPPFTRGVLTHSLDCHRHSVGARIRSRSALWPRNCLLSWRQLAIPYARSGPTCPRSRRIDAYVSLFIYLLYDCCDGERMALLVTFSWVATQRAPSFLMCSCSAMSPAAAQHLTGFSCICVCCSAVLMLASARHNAAWAPSRPATRSPEAAWHSCGTAPGTGQLHKNVFEAVLTR